MRSSAAAARAVMAAAATAARGGARVVAHQQLQQPLPLAQPPRQSHLSTQHDQVAAAKRLSRRGAATTASDETTTSRAPAPPITPDASGSPGSGSASDGRSSQTTATALAQKELSELARDVLRVFEAGPAEQRRLVERLYDEAVVYENNVSIVKGRDAIIKRFALLPAIATSVEVTYSPPVVLGATTSAPDALDNLASKAGVQVEVRNQQQYAFDRAHSMWRLIVLPQGDSQLDCLTRLTLSKDSPRKVLYHHDQWLGNSKWWAPLQKVFAVVETAASSVAPGGGGSGGDKSN